MKGPAGVAILTTTAVVMIQRIAEETESDQSVMCIDFRSQETGVSADYHRFVSPGTGALSRTVGSSVFRMDVDGQVDRGSSFQLAVFLAHVFHHAGNLAGTESGPPAEIVVATGEVDVKHKVRGVTEIPRKLAVLDAWLATRASRCPVRLMLPRENASAAAAALPQLQARGVTVQFVGTIDEIVDVRPPEIAPPPTLHRAAPSPPVPPAEPPPTVMTPRAAAPALEAPRGRSRVGVLAGGAVAAAALIATAFWAWNGGGVVNGTAAPPVRVTIVDVESAAGGCYGGERMTERYQGQSGGELVVTSSGTRCRLEARGATDQGQAQHAYLVTQNGQALASPEYLGPNGALLPQLLTDADVLEIAFSPAFPLVAPDVSVLPRIVVRLAAAAAD